MKPMLWEVFLDTIIFGLLEIFWSFLGFRKEKYFKIFQMDLKYLFVTSSSYFAIEDDGICQIGYRGDY